MSRCTITFEDSLEVDIKRYMQKKNVKLKSKAIREIVKNYFQYESSYEDFKEVSKKLDVIVQLSNIIKSLEEQIYIGMGIRENVNPKDNKTLQEFYDNFRKINFIIMK